MLLVLAIIVAVFVTNISHYRAMENEAETNASAQMP